MSSNFVFNQFELSKKIKCKKLQVEVNFVWMCGSLSDGHNIPSTQTDHEYWHEHLGTLDPRYSPSHKQYMVPWNIQTSNMECLQLPKFNHKQYIICHQFTINLLKERPNKRLPRVWMLKICTSILNLLCACQKAPSLIELHTTIYTILLM